MPWRDRLPTGVELRKESQDSFVLAVRMPTGDDGLLPLICPASLDHYFKVAVVEAPGDSGDTYCPYCGQKAKTDAFMTRQIERAEEAAVAAAEQYVHEAFERMMRNIFPSRPASSGSGVSITYTPGSAPARRELPAYEIEPTRRSMTCL